MNADEAAAIGTALHGATLTDQEGADPDTLTLPVAPMSISIRVQGDQSEVILMKNTTIPTKKTQTFTTTVDHQTSTLISVYEGDSAEPSENRLIGQFLFDGIPA